jgi:hypothetical protein
MACTSPASTARLSHSTARARSASASPINGDINPVDARAAARHAVDRAMHANPNQAEVQHVVGEVCWMLEFERAGRIRSRTTLARRTPRARS